MKSTRSKSILNIFTLFALLASLIGGALIVTPAHATVPQTHTVNTNADTNDGSCDALGTGAGNQDCTLREAIANAASGDTIVFDSALSGGTITLSSTLSLFSDVTIDGSALASQITISGNDVVEIFYVHTSVIATLDSLKLVKGNSSYGGAISAYGILTVNNSTFADNSASAFGGAIYAQDSTILITNTTFSGNHAIFYGGAISFSDGNVSVVNSTFSGNDADQVGGSIYFQGSTGTGTLNLSNSTFSDTSSGYGGAVYGNSGAVLNFANTIIANSTGGDCYTYDTIGTNTNNLVEDGSCSASLSGDPKLDLLLADNGGPTQTLALLPGSAAIDAGDGTLCAAAVDDPFPGAGGFDQRGIARPQRDQCDIGAFEYENQPPTDITLSVATVAENLPAGTTVGTLTTTDPDDPTDAHVYSFTCTLPAADDASFQIGGAGSDELQSAAAFDYETKNSYDICLRTDDGHGGTFDKAFTINVNDVPGLELLTPANADFLHYNRPTFEWVDFPGATSYHLQVSKNNQFSALALNATFTAPTYTPTSSLPANTLLYWRVRAKVGGAYGTWSSIWKFTTGNPPSTPILTTPFNNALVAGPSPLFNWNNSAVPAGTTFDHYQIQIAMSNAFNTIVHDLNIAGIANSQDATAIINPGTTYYWRVRSYNTAGDYSAWSLVRSVKIKFDAPTLLTPADGSVTGTLLPTVTWNAILGATNYNLQVSRNNTFTMVVLNKLVAIPAYTATINLPAGTTYYWRVRANGPYGPGAWSATFSFTTP